MKTIKEKAVKETIKHFFSGNCILTGKEQSPMIEYAVEIALKEVKKLIDECKFLTKMQKFMLIARIEGEK